MRVTILKRKDDVINGMWCGRWRVGQTYDLSPNLASVLIVEGCARLEMRSGRERRGAQRYPKSERRIQH